jgi:hypothetical protein
MPPTKVRPTFDATSALPMAKPATTPAPEPRRSGRSSARYSILSDPRLSQLFALSSQLEALAHTIELVTI